MTMEHMRALIVDDEEFVGLDGRAILRWVMEHQPDVDVIVLTGHGDVKDAVAAMKDGAWDFLIKDTPFDGAAVKAALARLRTVRELRRENLAARHGGYRQDAIVEGTSQAWRTVKTQIAQVAPSQAPVLIQGETGSGKDVVARLLHAHSRRAGGPFIAVNCGAVSRELLESELFGYEKGAFTGAAQAKPGLIAAAEGGSLFLDEIGEMPGPMQVSLLRFLDRKEYRPVGSTRTLRADVRIICATRTLSPEALAHLATYRWPGNVRELRNVIERIVLMSPNSGPITSEEVLQVLPRAASASSPDDRSHLPLDEIERLHIQLVLESSGGNKTKAAQTLRVDYKTLLAKLKKYAGGG